MRQILAGLLAVFFLKPSSRDKTALAFLTFVSQFSSAFGATGFLQEEGLQAETSITTVGMQH
jgi:hypothetical protein